MIQVKHAYLLVRLRFLAVLPDEFVFESSQFDFKGSLFRLEHLNIHCLPNVCVKSSVDVRENIVCGMCVMNGYVFGIRKAWNKTKISYYPLALCCAVFCYTLYRLCVCLCVCIRESVVRGVCVCVSRSECYVRSVATRGAHMTWHLDKHATPVGTRIHMARHAAHVNGTAGTAATALPPTPITWHSKLNMGHEVVRGCSRERVQVVARVIPPAAPAAVAGERERERE